MTMRTTWMFSIAVAFAACGGDSKPAIDAAPDTPKVTLDCPTYCAAMQAHCTGPNAQYADMAHCMATCTSFAVGASTVTDASGNTLGCRIHFAGDPSIMAPETNCVRAGPGGDLIAATSPAFCGPVCESFCTLEIEACGSTETPLPGNPKDIDGNPLYQYADMADCMNQCGKLDSTHAYGPTSAGNSLACRLNAATSAAIAVSPNAIMSCPDTAAAPTGACTGTATP